MRYPASEKLEIIRTVEGSHLPTKKRLICFASLAPLFIGGMIVISKVGLMHWQINLLDRDQSGTAFRRIGAIT